MAQSNKLFGAGLLELFAFSSETNYCVRSKNQRLSFHSFLSPCHPSAAGEAWYWQYILFSV